MSIVGKAIEPIGNTEILIEENFDGIGVCLQRTLFCRHTVESRQCVKCGNRINGGFDDFPSVCGKVRSGNGLAFGQVVKQPPAVDFGKGDASGTIDRIGQPDISVEEIGCHRNQFAVKIQKNFATCGQSLCKDAILYPFFSSEIPPGKRKVTISTPLVHPVEIRNPRNQSITRINQCPGQGYR